MPAPTPNDSWPQAGGQANHAMHHMQINPNIQEVWTVDIGAGTDDADWLIAQPIMADNRLYTMDSETEIAAFDPLSGDEIWRVELAPEDSEEGYIGGGIAYQSDKIFVTTGFAELICLQAETGKVLWRRTMDNPFKTAPTVRGKRVFAVTLKNKLYAIDGSNGQTLWTHSGIEETTDLIGGASPAVDAGVIVVPYSSGEIVALKIENGKELWSDSLAAGRRTDSTSTLSSIRGRPIIDRGIVIVISNSGQFTAINLRTGKRIWERNIAGIESPWVAGEFIFVLTNNSELVALSRKKGIIYWVTHLPQWEDQEDRTGKILWTGPVLASDRLIVTGSTGEALSISPYNGRILGKVEMPDGVTIGPIVAQNSIYFLSDDADLVAYR